MNKTDKMQEIVARYFKNVLRLPCPDFRVNLAEELNIKNKFYINESIGDTKQWRLSFRKPWFDGGESIDIDEETAITIMKLPKLLDFVERYNKQDSEKEIAEIASKLEKIFN